MKELATYDKVFAINVDIQNDFCPGGALGVDEGDQVVPVMNEVNEWVRDNDGDVIFTADWHPSDTAHFAEFGGPWPPHCIRFTAGAAFHNNLTVETVDSVARKGTGRKDDGYSGWFAELDKESSLYNSGDLLFGGGGLMTDPVETVGQAVMETALRSMDIERTAVVIGGLATDYCVKATVMDALKSAEKAAEYSRDLGIFVVRDAVRAVDVATGDGDKAIADMQEAGAVFVSAEELVSNQIINVAA